MEVKPPDPDLLGSLLTWAKVAIAFVIASVTGLVKYVQRFTADGVKPPWEWRVFCIKGATAGTMGVLTFWLLASWHFDPNYTHFCVAIAGWGGAETGEFFWELGKDAMRRAAGAASNGTPKN